MRRVRAFIGSSAEGLEAARAIQAELADAAETVIWNQGPFGLSGGNLESLVKAGDDFEFAVLVLTPDDLVMKRGKTGNAPRDIVIFEIGLFMGKLSRECTFMVMCSDDDLDLPSDLAGICIATYKRHSDGNMRAAVGPACEQIRQAIREARKTLPPTEPWVTLSPIQVVDGALQAVLNFERPLPFMYQYEVISGPPNRGTLLHGVLRGWSECYPETNQTSHTISRTLNFTLGDATEMLCRVRIKEMVKGDIRKPLTFSLGRVYRVQHDNLREEIQGAEWAQGFLR